jgi:hypothetical protein
MFSLINYIRDGLHSMYTIVEIIKFAQFTDIKEYITSYIKPIKHNVQEYIKYTPLTEFKKYLSQYDTNQFVYIYKNIISKLCNQFTLIETLLILDGIICSFHFLYNILLLKLTPRKLSKRAIAVYNEEIVHKYNSLYKLSTIDRYLFYFLIWSSHNLIKYFYNEHEYDSSIWFYICILPITLPFIQNNILNMRIYNFYLDYKNIFIKYSLAKMSIHFIQKLHPQIEIIQNYHIFIIYKILSLQFIWKIIHNFLFISLLTILRNYESTYYYYKGIKMAYYYNVGYLFNIIPIGDAIYLVNIIIKEKRWKELEKLEVMNAFFVLIMNKYEIFNSISGSFLINSQIFIFKAFSLYSLISMFKLLHILSQDFNNFRLWLYISLITFSMYLTRCNFKNIITGILIYFLIMIHINDIIITSVIITHKIIYYWFNEVLFYVRNYKNIKKVIKIYDTPSRNVIISKIKDEYIIC